MNSADLAESAASTDGRPASILVVEDEVVVSLDIQQKLTRLGYAVTDSAIGGQEAVRMAEASLPDLVLMDVQLRGDMDGIEAARTISERTGIPVVFLTAYGDEETLQRAKGADPFGYVVKPIEDKDLRTAVEVALYRHRTERALLAANQEMRRAQDDLQRQMELATAIGELGFEALERRDFGSLIRSALAAVRRLLSSDAVLIRRDHLGGFVFEAGDPSYPEVPTGIQVNAGWASQLAQAVDNPGPVQVTGDGAEPSIGFLNALGTAYRDGLMVRIDGYQAAWGVLTAASLEDRTFDEADKRFLQSAANVLSLVMRGQQVEDVMLELSAPVLPLDQGLLLMPLIGSFYPTRLQHLTDVLLQNVREHRARALVLDMTGLVAIGEDLANSLVQAVQAATLLGAKVIMSGVSPEIARTLVRLGIALDRVRFASDLRAAIEEGSLLVKTLGPLETSAQ